MKFSRIAVGVIAFSVVAGIAAFFAGCSKNEDISDEFARISSQEVSNMDANSSGMISSGGTPKLVSGVATASDTVTYDLTIHPFSLDSTDSCYIRTATLTCSDGFERVRVDTLTFFGATGKLWHPTLATVDSIHHVRHVKRDKGGNELNITVDMHSTLNPIQGQSGAYTHVKNGTITGTYDGENAITGTITDVTRNYVSGHWQLFPQSGSIIAKFPRRDYEIDFLGLGVVKLTITNNSTGKTKVVTITVDQQ
ncbi:MAG: hypothetical protein ABSF80_02435 [Chitinispirillaceae bacterium]|jgi:hypothetical protein